MKVLLIDDNADDRDRIAGEVRRDFTDAQFVHVKSADDLRAALGAGPIDAAIAEQALAWTTGQQLLEKLRTSLPGVPVLVATHSATQETAQEALDAGAADYFDKASIEFGRIRFAMRNALALRQECTALAAERARLRLALEASHGGTWDWDLKANKVVYSSEWITQTGHDETEVSNRFSEWASRLHPGDLDRAMGKIKAFLKDPANGYSDSYRFRYVDGSYCRFQARAMMLQDAEGRPSHLIGLQVPIREAERIERRRAGDRRRAPSGPPTPERRAAIESQPAPAALQQTAAPRAPTASATPARRSGEVDHEATQAAVAEAAAARVKRARQQTVETAPQTGAPDTILVVEDDLDIRAVVMVMLQRLGYRILGAGDGDTALAMLDRHPEIRLLLTDLVVEGSLAGKAIAAAARDRRPDLKFVYMSGVSTPGSDAYASGEDGIPLLTKPFRRDEIARVLRDLLED